MIIWVYMVRCRDGAYYVGSHRGDDCDARISEHNAGVYPKSFTYRRRPVQLVWCESLEMALDAIAVERQIKGWSRAKKEALIAGDWARISDLARRASPRPLTSSG
jgi:putative endonuclease